MIRLWPLLCGMTFAVLRLALVTAARSEASAPEKHMCSIHPEVTISKQTLTSRPVVYGRKVSGQYVREKLKSLAEEAVPGRQVIWVHFGMDGSANSFKLEVRLLQFPVCRMMACAAASCVAGCPAGSSKLLSLEIFRLT